MSVGEETGLVGRIWRSVIRGPIVPRSDRDRRWVVRNYLLLHFRPTQVPEKALRQTHTWGLGGSSLVLVTLLIVTGALMMIHYVPSPERAYESVVSIESDVLFGRLVRNVHYFSANLLVIVATLHLLRVFFTGGFLGPRQFNWIIGLTLLLGILAANFTGYLLPWDQLSYWAITISTGMLGYVPGIGEGLTELVRRGAEIGPDTLIFFFTVHTTLVPVALIVFMALHFWRVRRAGGVVVPRAPGAAVDEQPEKVLLVPNLLLRETAQAAVITAGVVVAAVLFNAPLGAAANPGMSPNPAKAPWYFAGFQELLLHLDPVVAVVVVPLLATLLLVCMPYIRHEPDPGGIWFRSRRGRRMALTAAASALVLTPLWVLADEYRLDLGGLVPVVFLGALLVALYLVLRRDLSLDVGEATQTLFVLLAVGYVVLTVTCVWFRGPGMALIWPWGAQ